MSDYLDTIDQLFKYSINKFSDPVEGWPEEKIKRRSYEQSFSERILLECYDNITMDPRDLIFERVLYYDYVLGRLDQGSLMEESFKCAARVCRLLLNFLETI